MQLKSISPDLLAESKFFLLPIWQAGFRPFFLLAFISGLLLPLAWGLLFSGYVHLPQASLPLLQWHAHEMLFGFGWAVLGGFLLTASKNWVKIRGIHGLPLAALALMWTVERFAALYGGHLSVWLQLILLNAFIISCGGYVLYSLIRYRRQDSFKDNYFFLICLPLFFFAKILVLNSGTFALGIALSIGLFRLAFIVMLERTTPQFLKNSQNLQVPRSPRLDLTIKFLVLASIFSILMPPVVASALLILTAILMTTRLVSWYPIQGLRHFGISIMYVGHFGLILHFLLEAMRTAGVYPGIGSLSIHVFTFLCMGIIIPGMLIRITQGHTGRDILFTKTDRIALFCMALAAISRLVLTQIWPQHYSIFIAIAAVGWALCFSIIGWRVAPFLWMARVDGRLH
ncbi:MAG: NnrS family protein [Bdellovibrionales bacterium]